MTRSDGPCAAVPGRFRRTRHRGLQPSPASFSPWTQEHAPRGFTLLEVLIAVVLSTILMAGLWALFNTYEALFSQGQAKAENAQLVRALFEQIARDLQSAIPDSAAGVPGQSASVRRFGLFGTESALQVDVLQVTDVRWALEATGRDEPAGPERLQNVPELHTVQYLFHETGEWEEESLESGNHPGLVRRELDWEAPAGQRRNPGVLGPIPARGRLNNRSTAPAGSGSPMELSATEFDPQDDSLLHVPEVVKLRFRYYDGSGWTTQWSSLAQKSLPVAVEVVLALKRPQESSRSRPSRATAVASEEDVAEEERSEEDSLDKSLTGSSGTANATQHRLLVFLPAAWRPPVSVRPPRGLPVRFALPPALPPPPPAIPPGPLLRGGPGAGSLRSVLPDQWMRGGT